MRYIFYNYILNNIFIFLKGNYFNKGFLLNDFYMIYKKYFLCFIYLQYFQWFMPLMILTVNSQLMVMKREYILHLPKNYGSESLPLVMVFHGGGGTADQIKDHTKFNKLADKENFIVVYPNSVDKNWNDGRIGDKLPMDRDDVKFINMLLDTLIANYKVNSKRIFSTGISNGGFFSFYLALKLSDRILAIAPVTKYSR